MSKRLDVLPEEIAVTKLIVVAAAIEAVGAHVILGQTYRLHKILQTCKLQGGEP